MKSFFTYSRLVFDHGALDGASEVVVGGAQKTGEALGAAVETVGVFWKRMQVLKTSKDALRALREGYNRTANPLEKYPSDEEKNKQLLDFVAAQLKYPVKDVRDALYKPVGKSTLSEDKRRDILQKIIVLQSILPEMELTFAGVATHELIKPEDKDIDAYAARILNSHNDAWYKQRKNLFAEMMEKDISPNDVAFYLVKHQNIIQEYINSPKPKDVAAKYPELFLTESAGEINGHNLLDIATAYENARINVDLLHKSPDIQNASRDIPTPMHYSLYIFDIPKARKSGVTMKYRSIGEGQVGASGISDEPASRNAPISIPGLPGLPGLPGGAPEEKALDGKEGERLDPIGDIDTFAKAHKWKGAQLDPDVHGSRFDHTDLAKCVPRVERVLNDIATNPKYKDFWPILGDMSITVTPDDVRDINPFTEGFSWDNGKLKIDYNESEESIRHDVIDGLRSYNAYKKLGGFEKPEVKKDREELVRQTELFIKNYDLLFPDYKNDVANKNLWKANLEEAKDPSKFAAHIESDPMYAEKKFSVIREAVRESYIASLKRYIDGWDANIGVAKTDDGSYMENIRRYIDGWISAVSVGKKDGGGYTKQKWLDVQEHIADSPDPRNIDFVVGWSQYFKANLEGTPVRDPVIVEGGKDKPTENHDSADKQKNDVIAALAKLSTDTGVKVTLMPEYSNNTDASDDEYEYDEMLKKLPALSAALKSLTPDEKTGANNIGVLLTPERNLVRLGVPHVYYSHGLVEQTDGTKKIQIDVKSDTLKDIRAALSDSPEKQKSDVIAALAKLSTESGVKVDLMSEYSDSSEAKDDEYEYKEILKKLPALSAKLKSLTPDEKTEANKIGVLLTPERNLVRVGMPRAYLHGLVEQTDGTKKIQIDVKNDTLSDIRAAIKKNSGKEGEEKEKTEEEKVAIKKKIKEKIDIRDKWKAQSAEEREAEDFAGTGLTLEKIAKIFKIEGDPVKEDYPYKLLGDQIYGPENIPETAKDLKSQVKKMLLGMSDFHKFNITLQDMEYDYAKIKTKEADFNKAFAAVKPSTQKVLARAGVVLGKIDWKGDEEGVMNINGKYRIVIDWNEDADEITDQLNTYANEYESEVKDKKDDRVDDMTDLEMKEACDKRLNKLKKSPYKIKEFKYADGFDDYKGLLKGSYFGNESYLDGIEKAFAGLSDEDKKALFDDGGYTIVISTGSYKPWGGQGKTSDHTITIDYDEASDDIKSDISNGIKDQKPSIVDKALGLPGWLLNKVKSWF